MANDALKIVTHDDVDLGKRPFGRLGAPTPVDSVDPNKLMEVLGDIDSLKREIQDRMRRIEAVRQAKSLLMEDAMRTEALNKRLAEIGKVMSAVHSGFLAVDVEEDAASGPRLQSREPVAIVESRPAPVLVMHEGVAIAWPKQEEMAVAEAPGAAAAELTVSEAVATPLEVAAAEVEERPLAESAVEAPTPDLSMAEMPLMAEEAEVLPELELGPVGFEAPLAEVVDDDATAPAAEFGLELSAAVVEAAASEVGDAELEASEAREVAAYSPSRAEALVAEARRLLEESSARLDVAVEREEQAAEKFRATEESLSTAYRSATGQLSEAERFWRLADEAAAEAKRLFDESTAQLTVAVSKEQQSAADFHSAQQALTAAYQAAIQRLEAAEQFSKEGEGFAQETRKLLERMEAELGQARGDVRSANEDLHSARQELTTAYQFASVAAQRRLDSAEFFRKTASWVVFSTAFAWMAAVWMAWAAFQRSVPIAIPFAASCLILAAAIFIKKRGARALEEV